MTYSPKAPAMVPTYLTDNGESLRYIPSGVGRSNGSPTEYIYCKQTG